MRKTYTRYKINKDLNPKFIKVIFIEYKDFDICLCILNIHIKYLITYYKCVKINYHPASRFWSLMPFSYLKNSLKTITDSRNGQKFYRKSLESLWYKKKVKCSEVLQWADVSKGHRTQLKGITINKMETIWQNKVILDHY